MKNLINGLQDDVRLGMVVSGATTGSGIGVILDLIPNNIGKLATCIGIVLSIVLIFTHLRKGYIEHQKTSLEVEILKAKFEDERNANERSRIIAENLKN